MPESTLIATMAERSHLEPAEFKRVIKATCGLQDAKDEEFLAFLMIAAEHGFNPLTREIYAFRKSGGGIQPIVGVDGWYKKANQHPAFNGIEFTDVIQGGELVAVTAKVRRKDRDYPTEVTEYMKECRRNTDPWKQWPARMLRHKSAIQAIRIAFNLAGIMDPDEAERYDEMLKGREALESSHDDLPGGSRTGRVSPMSGAAAEISAEVTPPPQSETAAPPPPPEPPPDEVITDEESDQLVKLGDLAHYSLTRLRKYVKERYQVELAELRKSQYTELSAEFQKRATNK